MADNPNDKTPEAIKKHKLQQTHEMPGPDGSKIRKDMANQRVAKDQERFGGDRAMRHAQAEKEKIANKEHVRDGTRGRLTKEMEKASTRGIER